MIEFKAVLVLITTPAVSELVYNHVRDLQIIIVINKLIILIIHNM